MIVNLRLRPLLIQHPGILRCTLFRLKLAAAADQRTVKDLVLEFIEGKLQEMEKKGLLPKRK